MRPAAEVSGQAVGRGPDEPTPRGGHGCAFPYHSIVVLRDDKSEIPAWTTKMESPAEVLALGSRMKGLTTPGL